ncbi:hypothetical protein HHL22_22610 [Hymenobacter sp. RP-2-7]|uniref:Uncharacterized protein n=1 Tax=Hymenobacter polaris TaxID=2682546 RepID=A0A7Y0AIK5_9BACT|nr:hypothetical protein [Hymenobacter polaris]NML68002.1 hypothetical protein [Hymenobacter polaris]
MITADLPALPPGAGRIPFALASAQQVVQALAYATERLAAHFPTLDWATWNDTFRHVQPELVVHGPAVWLEWPALARLVQQLASSLACSLLDPPGYRPAVTETAVLLTAYQSLARQALTQSTETPGCTPLLDELAPMLAKGHAIASRVCAATPEPADEAPRPDPLVPDQQPASAAPEPPTVGLSAEEAIAPNPPMPPAPAPASEDSPSTARRTFRDIVQHHPRANGKVGFTVRELCRAMRISAASLQEAHANPGRLSLTAVSALATLMQESLLSVLADLMAGAGTRKKRRNRGRVQ